MVDLSDPQLQTESQNPEESALEEDVRRSSQERRQLSYYRMEHSHLLVQKEPESIEEATTCSESSKWTQAMETEMKSLKDNDVWELVELPECSWEQMGLHNQDWT